MPDYRKGSIYVAASLFTGRLQDLLSEQRAIRFEFLLQSKSFDCAIFKSLDEVSERIDKHWDATEEGVLSKSNSHYGRVSQEIKDIQSKWDPEALTAPLRVLDQDPQYRAERLTMADRVQELQRRISPN